MIEDHISYFLRMLIMWILSQFCTHVDYCMIICTIDLSQFHGETKTGRVNILMMEETRLIVCKLSMSGEQSILNWTDNELLKIVVLFKILTLFYYFAIFTKLKILLPVCWIQWHRLKWYFVSRIILQITSDNAPLA